MPTPTVADTSARYDREIKLPLYARHGVPEVWIVDLEARLLRLHRLPVDGVYTEGGTTDRPGPTPVVALPGVMIDLSMIFG